MLTRPSSPSRHCTYRNHFNPPGDIPEQLAAYSAHTLSTALFMLGKLKQYGINCFAQERPKCLEWPGIEPATL